MMAAAAPPSIAAAIRGLGEGPDEGDTTCGEILARLGRRGYGLAMLLLAAPNLTPGPSLPGFSTLFGIPIAWLAAQMLFGRTSPRLPRFIAERKVPRARLNGVIAKFLPICERVDRMIRPRLEPIAAWHRFTAFGLLVQGLLLTLPLPLVSYAAAAAVLLLAVGLIGEDGLVTVLGHLAAIATLGLYVAGIWFALKAFGWI